MREPPRSDGVELRDCRNVPLEHDQDLHNCDFRGFHSSMLNHGVVLDGVNLTDASLVRARIRGMRARVATLVRTQLQYANLFSIFPDIPTDFHMSDLTQANLYETNVNWKFFGYSAAELSGATWFDGRVCAQGSFGWCQ